MSQQLCTIIILAFYPELSLPSPTLGGNPSASSRAASQKCRLLGQADHADKMRAAFRVLDPDRTGSVDRAGLRGVLRDCSLGHLLEPSAFERLCALFAAPGVAGGAEEGGGGRVDYRGLMERVREDPLVQAGYGSPRGAAKVTCITDD